MAKYDKNTTPINFAPPSIKLAGVGAAELAISALSKYLEISLNRTTTYLIGTDAVDRITNYLQSAHLLFLVAGIATLIAAALVHIFQSDASKIHLMVAKALFASEHGNPLKFKDGELLPKISCRRVESDIFELTITATTVTVEKLIDVSDNISACLSGKYENYAVTDTSPDLALNKVCFRIEDVEASKALNIGSIDELCPMDKTRLVVQQGTSIDLRTSGSMLVAGKTRSGKTTGVISLLLQVLLAGSDDYLSQVLIIDPKQAELSRLSNTVTLNGDGEATTILEAIKYFAETIRIRQEILNDLSEIEGNAVNWWESKMKPSFLFIDEYVALRSILPKRTKDNGDYNLENFDNLIKRIVTMGASAGCFIIISIAEASVNEGGLPAMLRSACSTKILFKPTITEARLMWDSEKLRNFHDRNYNVGDAWFSSTDGINDNVSFVHFPVMEFEVFRELSKLLRAYYHTL